jgi:hypothetical protein
MPSAGRDFGSSLSWSFGYLWDWGGVVEHPHSYCQNSQFNPDADWKSFLLVYVFLEGFPSWWIPLPLGGGIDAFRRSADRKLLPSWLLNVPERVLGVDVILLVNFGLCVGDEAVNCSLPSTTLAIDGSLPD